MPVPQDITSDKPDSPKISVIILNWNGWRDTLDCLDSLHRISYPSYLSIIVDNGSTDGSLDKIRAYCEAASSVGMISIIPHCQENHLAEPTYKQNGITTELKQIVPDKFDNREAVSYTHLTLPTN